MLSLACAVSRLSVAVCRKISKGEWHDYAGYLHIHLRSAPFSSICVTGTALEVKVLPGCLILTAQEPPPEPPEEPEVVTTLRRACKKLSERKRREIAEFIQMIAAPQKRPRKTPEGMVEWRRLD
ncbi:hypothetical protein [Pantoea ananatis]|uniref:hypothetical protein n=1 Tax=Pantoea ananas TaxID=553 RepID=UPI00046439EA